MGSTSYSATLRIANDVLHDIELRADSSRIMDDPMNAREVADPSDMVIEQAGPSSYNKEVETIDEEDSEMESESDELVPFAIPKSLSAANKVLNEDCDHMSFSEISKGKIYMTVNTPCFPTTSAVVEPEPVKFVENTNDEVPDNVSVLMIHLRGIKGSRDFDELPAQAKRIILDYAA